MQYKVVDAYSYTTLADAISNLEYEVKKLLEDGWKPQGGVTITVYQGYSTDRCCVAQAMVKDV